MIKKEYVISICAILLSLIALVQTCLIIRQQQVHNYLSVKPIPVVETQNFDELLSVRLRNAGTGPMIILEFIASHENQKEKNIINLLPECNKGAFKGTHFSIRGGVIQPGESYQLLYFQGKLEDEYFENQRDTIKAILANTNIVLRYTDIYNNEFGKKVWKLNSFREIITDTEARFGHE